MLINFSYGSTETLNLYSTLFRNSIPGRPPSIPLTVRWIYAEEGEEMCHATNTRVGNVTMDAKNTPHTVDYQINAEDL